MKANILKFALIIGHRHSRQWQSKQLSSHLSTQHRVVRVTPTL